MSHRIKQFLFVVMIFLLSCSGRMENSELVVEEKETLRGLKGVYVLVENLSPDIEEDELKLSTIQTNVELKLRMAGIKVLTREESSKELGIPFLYVQLNIMKSSGSYVFSILIELREWVYLTRDTTIECTATTWRNGTVGVAGSRNLDFIRDSIKDYVDKFINDYLSMNPKE